MMLMTKNAKEDCIEKAIWRGLVWPKQASHKRHLYARRRSSSSRMENSETPSQRSVNLFQRLVTGTKRMIDASIDTTNHLSSTVFAPFFFFAVHVSTFELSRDHIATVIWRQHNNMCGEGLGELNVFTVRL
jgi:hypothetical protein